MPKYKTALVTGGAGFIGSHIVDALVRRRIKTYVVDDLSTGNRANLNPNARFFHVSITHPKFKKLLEKIRPDIVFHTAAQVSVRVSNEHPLQDAKSNILGTLALLEAAPKAGVKKIVFSSTGGPMYPVAKRPPWSESLLPEPYCPYAVAKLSAEHYCRLLCARSDIACVILRYANVYGPRQNTRAEGGVVAIFADRMLGAQNVHINGTGKQSRDFVYVDDVVRANMLAMQKSVTGIFNIGTGKLTTINALFKMLKKATGSQIAPVHGPALEGEVLHSALESKLARKALDWKPETRLEEGILKTVKWMKKREKV